MMTYFPLIYNIFSAYLQYISHLFTIYFSHFYNIFPAYLQYISCIFSNRAKFIVYKILHVFFSTFRAVSLVETEFRPQNTCNFGRRCKFACSAIAKIHAIFHESEILHD